MSTQFVEVPKLPESPYATALALMIMVFDCENKSLTARMGKPATKQEILATYQECLATVKKYG